MIVTMKKILFIIIAGLISLSVDAQKWYVATTGDDANGDGSITYPWKTVKHAADTITTANGFTADTIYLNAGTFVENAQIVLDPGISIMGAGATSIIESTYTSAWHTGLIEVSSAQGDAVNGNQSISYIKMDGNLVGQRAIEVDFRKNVVIHHCTFIDFLYSGITVWGMNSTSFNVTPTNVVPTGCEIHDCIFTNCTQKTGHSAPGHIRLEGTKGFKVYNNTFDQTDRAAGENSDIFIAYQNYGLKVYDNVWTRDDTNGTDWNFFAEQHYSLGGFEMYGNTFNGAACYDFSGSIRGDYAFGAQIHDNTFTTAAAPLIGHAQAYLDLESFDYENDIYVYANKFVNARYGIILNNIQVSADNIWIYYNIFENTGNSQDNYSLPISVSSGYASAVQPSITNVYIYNNVIDAGAESFAGILISMVNDIEGLFIKNNIINGNFESAAIDFMSDVTPEITNLEIKNNLYYGTAYNDISYDAGITYIDRDTSGNIVSDPLFVGGSPYSWKLQESSPAKDAGISVGLTSDYGGYNVPVGPLPDIGAWEYGADVTPPNWHPTGLGWDDNYFKNNFRDTVNFTVPPTIAGAPLNLAALLPSGLTATVNDLNATAGATGNFQGQINTLDASNDSKADTSLSNLSSVAINSNLLPNAAGTIDLGSATLPFDDLHLDTASQINFHNGDITATHSDGTLTFAGGNIVLPSTTSIGDVSSTEISYVNGVTGAIQTQINNMSSANLADTILTSADENRMRTSGNWKANTSYEIRDSINLGGNTIDLPENVTLKFNGGKLVNGELDGDHASFISNGTQIFDTTLVFDGMWQTATITPQDYGAITTDTVTNFDHDCSPALRACVATPFNVYVPAGNYYYTSPIIITKPTNIKTDAFATISGQWIASYKEIQMTGTRFYTNQNSDLFVIRRDFFNFIGYGVIDFTQTPSNATCAAFRYDLNKAVSWTKIQARVYGELDSLEIEGNATKGIFIDGTNLTTSGGSLYWADFDLYTLYIAYPFYFPHYSSDALSTTSQANWLKLLCDSYKKAIVLKEGSKWWIDANWQDRAVLVGDETNYAGMEINASQCEINISFSDAVHPNFVVDSGAQNIYTRKSLGGGGNSAYEDYKIQFDGERGEFTAGIIENPQSFLINQSYPYATEMKGISYIQNALAYFNTRYPNNVAIHKYDGTGYDFDTELTASSGLPDEPYLSISDTNRFFTMRGEKPLITFTNASALDSGFVEIVITFPAGVFVANRPFFLNYYIISLLNNRFKRIQTILTHSGGTLVSNIYPRATEGGGGRTYIPFKHATVNTLSGITTLIIRFIGAAQANQQLVISDIFARDLFNTYPPVIDIGGGQRIYGTGGLTVDSFLKLTPQADPPASASTGMIYVDTDGHVYCYLGGVWKQLDN